MCCILCTAKILPGDESPWSEDAHFECEVNLLSDDPDAFWDWYWDVMMNP